MSEAPRFKRLTPIEELELHIEELQNEREAIAKKVEGLISNDKRIESQIQSLRQYLNNLLFND